MSDASPAARLVRHDPARGALFMLAACTCFAVMNALFRQMAELGVHPFQSAFMRSAFALLFLMPILWRRGGVGYLRSTRKRALISRGIYGTGGMVCWAWAVALLPLAEATAINFAAPLFGVLGSALILRERVRFRRWAAVTVGFLGVLIVIRPDAEAINLGAALALAAAMFMAAASLATRSLTGTEPSDRVVIWATGVLTVMTLPMAIPVWVVPNGEIWLVAVALGLVGAVGHSCMTRAFAHAEASMVMPLDYSRLPLVAAIGYLAYAEIPTVWTWVGGAVIAGSAIYIARREAQLARPPLATEKPH